MYKHFIFQLFHSTTWSMRLFSHPQKYIFLNFKLKMKLVNRHLLSFLSSFFFISISISIKFFSLSDSKMNMNIYDFENKISVTWFVYITTIIIVIVVIIFFFYFCMSLFDNFWKLQPNQTNERKKRGFFRWLRRCRRRSRRLWERHTLIDSPIIA